MKKAPDTSTELMELRKIQANKKCFDCNQAGTTYAVPELGIFLCSICGGIHREFNHRVKGLSTCNFSEAEVSKLKSIGNEKAAAVWLARHDPRITPVPDIKDSNRLKEFLRLKYIERRFYATQEVVKEVVEERRASDTKVDRSVGFINLIDDEPPAPQPKPRDKTPPPSLNTGKYLFQASFPNGNFKERGAGEVNQPAPGPSFNQPAGIPPQIAPSGPSGPAGPATGQAPFNPFQNNPPQNSQFYGQGINPNPGNLVNPGNPGFQTNPNLVNNMNPMNYAGQGGPGGQGNYVGQNPGNGGYYPQQGIPGSTNPSNPQGYSGLPAQNNPNVYTQVPMQNQPYNPNPMSQPVNQINFNLYTSNAGPPSYSVYSGPSVTPPGMPNTSFSSMTAPGQYNPYQNYPSSTSPSIVPNKQQVFFNKSSDPFEQLIEEEKQKKMMQHANRNQPTPQQALLMQQFSVQAQLYEKNYGVPFPYSFQQWINMSTTGQEVRPHTKNPFDMFG